MARSSRNLTTFSGCGKMDKMKTSIDKGSRGTEGKKELQDHGALQNFPGDGSQ